MLTWALVYMLTHGAEIPPIMFLMSMIFDVAMVVGSIVGAAYVATY